jgi:hypothetical protein
MLSPDTKNACHFIIDTCALFLALGQYATAAERRTATQLSLRAKWHLRQHPDVYPTKLMRERLRIAGYGRRARVLKSLVDKLPEVTESSKLTFQNNQYAVDIENVMGGFFIAGTVGARRPDLSTTIVAAISKRNHEREGPYDNSTLREVIRGAQAYNLQFDAGMVLHREVSV